MGVTFAWESVNGSGWTTGSANSGNDVHLIQASLDTTQYRYIA